MGEHNYIWEAYRNGEKIADGGDLTGCSIISFTPRNNHKRNLARVDISGVKLDRRFVRVFIKARLGGGKIPCLMKWEAGSNVVMPSASVKEPPDLRKHLSPGMLIARVGRTFPWYVVVGVERERVTIHKPYEGKSKDAETRFSERQTTSEGCLHCVVCDGFRLYLNDKTGQVTITPEEYELYL